MSNEKSYLYEVTTTSMTSGPPRIERYQIVRDTPTQLFVIGLTRDAERDCFAREEIGGRVFTNLGQALAFALHEIARQELELLAYRSALAKAQWNYSKELASLRTEELQQFYNTYHQAQSLLDDKD